MDISPIDLINIESFANRVIHLFDYRKSLQEVERWQFDESIVHRGMSLVPAKQNGTSGSQSRCLDWRTGGRSSHRSRR